MPEATPRPPRRLAGYAAQVLSRSPLASSPFQGHDDSGDPPKVPLGSAGEGRRVQRQERAEEVAGGSGWGP